ncbi:unnamed protein product [Lepeophtheirus salmonis]|uniref:(salmon louse) hypothetical protein n=1 Tax=Lepeophtheirus salmonis TaxID=72036 RepID=A0A7R8D051_LEPSM|nr:unnamed protein product [Lepeophtheirus salmonis]CAF2956099.1 unnamed protein product [Lepeophtheirus salmonis]
MHYDSMLSVFITTDLSPFGLGVILSPMDDGIEFLIRSDHQPIKYIFNPTKELPPVVSAQLQADSPSRSPIDDPVEEDNSTDSKMSYSITSSRSNEEEPLETIKEDDSVRKVIDAARSGDYLKVEERAYTRKKNHLSIRDSILFWGIRTVAPSSSF